MKKASIMLIILLLLLNLSSCDRYVINLPESLFLIRAEYEGGFTFFKTGESAHRHARTAPSLYLPWDDSLYAVGTVDSGIDAGGESIPLSFTVGLNDRALPDGDLRISIITDDFIATSSGAVLENNAYVIKDFFSSDKYKSNTADFTVYLSPDFSDGWAVGEIHVSAQYIPHDMKAFMEEMGDYLEYSLGLVEDDFLYLYTGGLAYAADSAETWMKRGSSYGDVFNDISKYHYEKGMISTKEMAEFHFGYKQMDKVNTYVYDYDETAHTMKIGYFSENIRYAMIDCQITDEELEEAILSHESFWNENHYMPAKRGTDVALRILEIMRERGVISEAEYLTELDLIEASKGVYADLSKAKDPFPVSGYPEVHALRFTHSE